MVSISFVVLLLGIAIQTSQGVVFDCHYGITTIAIGSVYACTPTIRNAKVGETLTDVGGVHVNGKSNRDVDFLYIYKQDLTYIPKGIEKFFPNLRAIDYQNSTLTTISSEDLKPFPRIILFYATFGNLVSLEGNLFQHNPNLQYVIMNNNKIANIGQNLLGGLNQLKFVNFGNNPCVNKTANSLETIRALNQQLSVSCPPIKVIDCSDRLLICNNEKSGLSSDIKRANERIAELERVNKQLLARTCA